MINRSPRYDVRVSAEVRVGGRRLTGLTRNLSVGGVCLELDQPLTEGARVEVTLFFVEDDIESDTKGLGLIGTVQWVAEADRGVAVGLRFGPLSPPQEAAIGAALKAIGA